MEPLHHDIEGTAIDDHNKQNDDGKYHIEFVEEIKAIECGKLIKAIKTQLKEP